MPHGDVLPAPEPRPLSPADRSRMCRFAASLPQAHLEFAGTGTGRVLAMLTVTKRRFLFERVGQGIRVRDMCERAWLAEAGTIERVLAALHDRLRPHLAGEGMPVGPETKIRPEVPEATKPPSSRRGVGERAILVVEDQPYSAQEWEELLGPAGYRPLLAPDGSAALATAAGLRHPALGAVVSLQLRGAMGGREVVQRLRQQFPGLPVVAVTGLPPPAPQADLRGLGGPTVRLVKPIEAGRLLQCLADVIAASGGAAERPR